MTYDSHHILVFDPQTGYNRVATEYKTYHPHLDSFYHINISTFFPADAKHLHILDLGAGDGRMYKTLSQLSYDRYVACDIAEKLLERHPGDVEKVVCDLEEPLPFPDMSFDLITSFFVLEHISNITGLFQEVQRILKPGGIWIIGHFLQRREFIRKQGTDQFKIQQYSHPIKKLEKLAHIYFPDVYIKPLEERKNLIGYLLVCQV